MGCASQPTGRGSLEQIRKEKRSEWALSLFNTTPGTNYSLQIRTKTHYWTASILGKNHLLTIFYPCFQYLIDESAHHKSASNEESDLVEGTS